MMGTFYKFKNMSKTVFDVIPGKSVGSFFIGMEVADAIVSFIFHVYLLIYRDCVHHSEVWTYYLIDTTL